MNESELYHELGSLTRDRGKWEESIPYVSSLLTHESCKIRAKALWLLGEMGLKYPDSVRDSVPAVASFLDSAEPLLRERAVNALGRIGRADFPAIQAYWPDLFRFAYDEEPKVRLSFIWASENIAANSPGVYENHMPVFAENRRNRQQPRRQNPLFGSDPGDRIKIDDTGFSGSPAFGAAFCCLHPADHQIPALFCLAAKREDGVAVEHSLTDNQFIVDAVLLHGRFE